MKKLFLTLMCLIVLTAGALPAAAQTRYRTRRQTVTRQQQYRSDRNRQAYYDYDGYRDDRSVWEKHRDKITTAGGAVGGAVLGGLLGGKKGALLGAIAGGGGAAVYTYKIRKQDRRRF